jgi:hypothetical protein
MPHEHPSGLPAAYQRTRPNTEDVVFREGQQFYAQGAELNEAQAILRAKTQRVGNLTAKDGDRVEGCSIVVEGDFDEGEWTGTGTVTITPGRIYVLGDVRPIGGVVFEDLDLEGDVIIGVRVIVDNVTEEEDDSLNGLHPGTAAEGEPGAARRDIALAWGYEGDSEDGELYQVYVLKDGTPLDQSPPPALTNVIQQIARYDYDAHAHYIVDGCEVTALGVFDGGQLFSIAAGTANVLGFKRIRESAIRHWVEEDPDLETINAEPHTFTGPTDGQTVFTVNRAPIDEVISCVLVRRITESVVRGAVANTSDALTKPSVVEIESVVQGMTTFDPSTYTLIGNNISWGPAGAEPAAASTYDVTYKYNDAVTIDAFSATTVSATGGVNGTVALISYKSKIPRIDLMCMDLDGRPIYVKGLPSRDNVVLPPIAPTQLLKLAEVHNDWMGTPTVRNNGTRNYTYDHMRRYFDRVIDILDQFDRAEAERDILAREPVSKKGIFTDNFVDDFYRDQGEAQSAACNGGVLQLAVDPILLQLIGGQIRTLPYTLYYGVRQELATSSMLINPYANFSAFPAGLSIDPPVDFWTEEQVQWTSPVTREFTAAPGQPPGQSTLNEVTQIRRQVSRFLRQINITITIEGFGVGENLAELRFDGVNIKPAGTQTADAEGEIVVTVAIPANIPAGRRRVVARGAADSFAEAIFVGEGTIDITTMRRVTLVTRAAPVPVINNITNVTNNITNVTNITNVPVTTNVPPAVPGGWVDPWILEQERLANIDPLAQTFWLDTPGFVAGVDIKFTTIGNRANGVRVQLSAVQNGIPTGQVIAEAFVNMNPVVANEWTPVRFRVPVYLGNDREFCFVILTADNAHQVAIAKLGDVYSVGGSQRRVSAQAYTVGVLLSSANRLTWTPHQDADLTFRIAMATFTDTEISVDLWTGEFDQVSDVVVRGSVELPTSDARFRYELVRATGQVIQLIPGQEHKFSDYITEEVTLRAVLEGTDRVSPVLYPGTLLAGGRIRTSGTYVTRVFPMGTGVKVAAVFKSFAPAGSSLAVDVDAADDSWTALTLDSTGVVGDGWNEPKYQKTPYTAAEGRVRVTLNGGPAARIAIARFRAYSV